MTLTIEQAYELPRPEDIRAMGFVIKLKELATGTPEVRKLVDDYVVTPAVATDLPVVFEKMKQVFDRGEEYGRFIHGSFGSGKSHFMTMLSLLLEDIGEAWQKDHPAFAALRTKHHGWVEDAHLLVVRIHMLSVKGRGTGLDRAVYDGFNDALRRRGKAPFEFLHIEGVLDEARREAQQYGDVFWKNLANAGVVASKDDFQAMATSKSQKQREALARAYLGYKGRDAASAGIDPKWSEGLRRMADHAKAQGFGGVVLLIDEFLLWLGEKSGQEFVQAINDLNVIVDHSTGQRAVPMFVFVARQKDIREFYPDLVDESKLHEQLDHHAQRFEKTMLQDIELRHIVKERVLRPKAKEAIAEATARLAQDHEKILPGLLSNVDLAYLKDVYPFHPALIEMLIDITALMQRERSALRLLYELLVLHYPKLPLGEFLPVGSAFDAIFPRGGVEASKKVEVLQDIHRQYYERLEPAMRQLRTAEELDDKRHVALDQLVKTVLLAEVSPRLKGKGLTIERLVQLNSVDIDGETYRGRLRVAASDLVALSNVVPDLQVTSTDKTAIVRYVLGGVSLGEMLVRARAKVDNTPRRFEVFYGAIKAALGITNLRGFGDGEENLGDYKLSWRKTERKGTLRITNVRECSYDDFEAPAGAFTVLIDYPWDEPGHSVEADRQKAMLVRSNRGNKYTACWLPRHMSPSELAIMTDLAAVRFLQTPAGQSELLDNLAPADRTRLIDQAQAREKLLNEQLGELLRKVYIEHGEFFPLISDIDTKRPFPDLEANLKHIAGLVMDRRYPEHPAFLAEPKRADLARLLDWMVAAGDATTSVVYDDDTERVLKNIGQPLELVNLGQTKASLRIDSRYIKDVLQRADKDVVSWAEVSDSLREKYGFQPLILDLFLAFLCQRDHRALNAVSGEPIEVTIGMSSSAAVRLERGKLVSPAEWSRLRELATQVLGLPQPPPQRSLQQQDKLASAMRASGVERRLALEGIYERLGQLGVTSGARRDEITTARDRLAPLAGTTNDSFKVLSALLAHWPDKPDDPLRTIVHGAKAARDALAPLDDRARDNLAKGQGHSSVGALATEHVESLVAYLAAASIERPITAAWVSNWNSRAQQLIAQLIAAPTANIPSGTGTSGTSGPGSAGTGSTRPLPTAPERVLYNEVLAVGTKPSVRDAVSAIQAKLDAAPRGRVRVTITREDD
ncbi:MAG TPA: DUF6079 family protein [Kofleriaceae bacterium]|nr:DUF6079 family protein [Kofleriaceae bacterium]